MNDQSEQSTNPSAPVSTGSNLFGDWVSVEETVLLCEESGLSRTPKTIRKWASRSQGKAPGEAEITVRRQDTANGNFRWRIERVSLERKIEQELELLQSAQASVQEITKEPVHTGAHLSEPVRTSSDMENEALADANPSKPEKTGAHLFDPEAGRDGVVMQLEARIEDLKEEVDFYRDELRDRRQTTTALTDVIEAFKLTAAANAAKANKKKERSAYQPRIIEAGDNAPAEGDKSSEINSQDVVE